MKKLFPIQTDLDCSFTFHGSPCSLGQLSYSGTFILMLIALFRLIFQRYFMSHSDQCALSTKSVVSYFRVLPHAVPHQDTFPSFSP